jgi:beta-N-acetylhexosaminidase
VPSAFLKRKDNTLKKDVFALSEPTREWVKRTVAKMSLEHKVGQVINVVVGWFDTEVGKGQLEAIERWQIGSGISGGAQWQRMRATMEAINNVLKIPMAVNADFEMGANIVGGTHFPAAMGMSAIADADRAEELIYAAGKAAASQGRAVGVHWALAPVVDLNVNFRNPITNIRSYGDQVERVQRLTAAYIRGLQENGMVATAKHFPGDGYSDLDQHKVTTVNPLDHHDYWHYSGACFQNAVDTGVLTIMPGHIACPALDGSRNERGRPIPATFSPLLLGDVLRGRMGFTGLIVSDAFDMGGCLEHVSTVPEAAVKGLIAGLDCVLLIRDIDGVGNAILEAVEDGDLPESRLNEAVARMLSLKAWLGLHKKGYKVPSEAQAAKMFEPPFAAKQAQEAANLSVTLFHDQYGMLPLKKSRTRKVLINVLNEEQFWGDDGVKLFGNTIPHLQMADDLRARGIEVDVAEDPGEGHTKKIADKYDAIFYVFNNGPQASRCNIAPCRQALRDIDWTVINSGKPVIFVALRSPYLKYYLPGLPCVVLTYENKDVCQSALVKAVLGEIPFSGKCPVTVPENFG